VVHWANYTMARDLGVQADYVDRAFRKLEEQLGDSALAREVMKQRWRESLEALERMQTGRPMKPPGR
jgi:hypothetical protein